jgi:hypothetical protein
MIDKILKNSSKRKVCCKCHKVGSMSEVKTMAIHIHSPYYDYYSLYLCNECLEEFQDNFMLWLDNDSR